MIMKVQASYKWFLINFSPAHVYIGCHYKFTIIQPTNICSTNYETTTEQGKGQSMASNNWLPLKRRGSIRHGQYCEIHNQTETNWDREIDKETLVVTERYTINFSPTHVYIGYHYKFTIIQPTNICSID